jgi:hypothetical protein
MPKDAKVITGTVRFTVNSAVQLDFTVRGQQATDGRIFIRPIGEFLKPLRGSEQ